MQQSINVNSILHNFNNKNVNFIARVNRELILWNDNAQNPQSATTIARGETVRVYYIESWPEPDVNDNIGIVLIEYENGSSYSTWADRFSFVEYVR